MMINGRRVKGAVDQETRCKHYDSLQDRIAIKFPCCQEYFPCYQCHKEHGCGGREIWLRTEFHQKAILCGSCKKEMSIQSYICSQSECPKCQVSFNPGCKWHHHLYFDI
ncbi:CHY zinc finger protein [Oceanobacillus halophilus]|uniref:CHY-type domain-containing protein n=1 Tax=Oceanobacillus halophilus TaxID=930130 RepID=A0A494ZRP5_9BACI|nr:CHY zinc finger protein [Oceanobacillus halophilus]RKQ28429.1 hypothetical protein D8M06_18820 [Oceanobacillus halophilus]